MIIKGRFIEDMEQLQEHYEQRFVHFSCEYNFKGNQKAAQKMYDYQNCVEKMKKLMPLIDEL